MVLFCVSLSSLCLTVGGGGGGLLSGKDAYIDPEQHTRVVSVEAS